MRLIISLLFVLNSFAFVVPKVYNSGKLVDIGKDYYLIQTKSKELIKVKPFLDKPKVGLIVSYPISEDDISVEPDFLFESATKMVSNNKYTSDIIEAYLKTLAEVSKNGLYKTESVPNGNLYSLNFLNILDSIIPEACADGQECNNMCYFGGWPSTRKGSYCQAPWKTSKSSKVQAIDKEVYSSEFSCGGKNRFRCNPKIFGTYDSVLDPLSYVDTKKSKANGNKGICVKASPTYAHVTAQCLEATSKIPNFKESLKDRYNDNKEVFEKLIDNVNCFCGAKGTDKKAFSCNALKSRLATIFEKPAPKQEPVKVERPKVKPIVKLKPMPAIPIPRDDDGKEEKKNLIIPPKPAKVIVQEEKPLPENLIYYNCDFEQTESLFEGKNANCANKGVCLKKLVCGAYSQKTKKFDVKTKLLAYCPCDEKEASKCANAIADENIIRSRESDSDTKSSDK